MRCPIETEENLDLLLAYSSGKRTAPGMDAFEQHLEACAACREFVSGQTLVRAALDEWQPPAISGDFNRRLYHRIENQPSWWQRFSGSLRPLLGWRALPVAAAACLVVTVGIVLERPAAVGPRQEVIQIERVQPEQVVHAMDDLEMLDQFDRAVRADTL